MGATKSTLVKMIKLLMNIVIEFTAMCLLSVKGHPVVSEGKKESPDHLCMNVNPIPLVSFQTICPRRYVTWLIRSRMRMMVTTILMSSTPTSPTKLFLVGDCSGPVT